MSERRGTKALELWCKRLVKDCPNVQIDNMTTSWRNGIAFCALVHHFRPDLMDMSLLKPENIYENNQLAFNIAEKYLGIPALLDPEDMVENDVPDRLSILTYLSQFYQRLGHTVSTKGNESDSIVSSSNSPASSSQSIAPFTFGKVAMDKCVACGLPVYLAQRLIVSHKLYHRQCYCCSKCSAQLNPGNIHNSNGTEFICDNCVTEHKPSKYISNDNDAQMGMLAFTDGTDVVEETEPIAISDTPKRRSQSILDKISLFEKYSEENLDGKLEKISLKEPDYNKSINKEDISMASGSKSIQTESLNINKSDKQVKTIETNKNNDLSIENSYKSDIKKITFLQTQLSDDKITDSDSGVRELEESVNNSDIILNALIEEHNVTDDTRIANNSGQTTHTFPETEVKIENEATMNVPPRRKKRVSIETVLINQESHVDNNQKTSPVKREGKKDYPDHLNPFSDDEEENANPFSDKKHESTNPFGSSDEDDQPTTEPPSKSLNQPDSDMPQKIIIAANPFWSDGEEPSSDEESRIDSSMYDSSLATSTPNLRASTPRKQKPRAPPPPAAATAAAAATSDDVASLSSMSSYNSTAYSDQKSVGKLTPRLKKRVAPTPPDSVSTLSASSRDLLPAAAMEKGDDMSGSWKQQQLKRPAPGLPLPARRTVRAQLEPGALAAELALLEAQQAGLERQGVRLEHLIREKCEGPAAAAAAPPAEQVEELVIQLCELVNEKNELFRKQTELMYIRRQQRLEQEQADIEHEIRVIQSRPAVNRIDADKAREEQLVARLVGLVRLRDELVQQLDCERRREAREDRAVAASIAARRAQRNSDSNSSSMTSTTTPPKKNKVKDKMKKQFKKAKHTLISKKKDDSPKENKGDKPEKAK